ncbi:ribosome maturation factor RimM [Litorimonas sp. RW-G-Af-16]|uniref:ribosome maturation factor RimM n=1 Tax=Litorimonas sp. RW-G-Af-16 TaxID=3241168 RepID=UPI00390CB815
MAASDKLICVGAIAGAFGVKGEVKVKSFTADPAACFDYGPLLNEAGAVIFTPTHVRPAGAAFAVTCPEVTTREEAEAMKSTKLYVLRASLPEPDEDDFYYTDLIGLDVKTTAGQRMGKIIAIHEFGAGDMLEIQPPKDKLSGKTPQSFYHPFTKLAVPKVDLVAGRAIIEIIEPDVVPKESAVKDSDKTSEPH